MMFSELGFQIYNGINVMRFERIIDYRIFREQQEQQDLWCGEPRSLVDGDYAVSYKTEPGNPTNPPEGWDGVTPKSELEQKEETMSRKTIDDKIDALREEMNCRIDELHQELDDAAPEAGDWCVEDRRDLVHYFVFTEMSPSGSWRGVGLCGVESGHLSGLCKIIRRKGEQRGIDPMFSGGHRSIPREVIEHIAEIGKDT